MATRDNLATKLLNLTEDRKTTQTVTPSFLEVLAPLLSILYFSGGGEGIAKMLGMGDKKGMLPSSDMMGNLGNVQNMASSLVGDVRGSGTSVPLGNTAQFTPQQLIQFLASLGGGNPMSMLSGVTGLFQ